MRKKIVKLFLTCIISMVLIISSVLAPVIANTIQGELICTEEGHEHNNECYAINEEDKEEVLNEKVGVGDFSVKISEDIKSGLSYEAKVKLYTENKIELDLEIREYQVIDKDGNIKEDGNTVINDYIFDNLEPGDEIVIKGIPYIDENQKKVLVSVEFTSSEEGYKFDYEPSQEVLIKELDISSIVVNQEVLTKDPDVFSIPLNKNETSDTFVTLGGSYSLKYILKNYNIFSFNDIEGTHIVGPVIAKNRAYRTGTFGADNSLNGGLSVSDYSKGISSYIGQIKRANGSVAPTVKLNYGFDYAENTGFSPPNFYVDYTNNNVKKVIERYYMIDNAGDYGGPNNSSNSPILQNNNFINFEDAYSSIMAESQRLLQNKYNIEISLKDEKNPKEYEIDPNTGYLKIDAGGNYLIKDASRLRVIDIQYPKDYDPIKNPYPYNTVINISDDELVKNKIKGRDYFFFPTILVNGKEFGGTYSGAAGEYNDKGNSIVWNLPNIVTEGNTNRVVTKSGGNDFLGHIVAPNAEFWNIDENGNWKGGNNNGCAIVKSWHAGMMEGHMWPYNEDEIGYSVGELVLDGKKVFEGFTSEELNDKEFKFTLKYDGGTPPSGVLNQNIPQTVTQSNGVIEFLPLKFTDAGTYYFIIKEVIPENTDGIIYDKSEYKVEVEVTKGDSNNLNIVSTVTKVKDESGNSVNDTTSEIVFTNKKEQQDFSTSLDIQAKKEFIGGDLSTNTFEFNLDKFDNNQSLDGVENFLPQTISQGDNGVIKFNPITFTKEGTYSFRIKEVIPENDDGIIYDKSEYKIDVNVSESSGRLTASINKVTQVKDENGNKINPEKEVKKDIVFKNTKSDEVLPVAGGNGITKLILIGMFLMITSTIIFIGKSKIEVRK